MRNNFIYTKDITLSNYDFIYKYSDVKYIEDLKTRSKELFMLIKEKIPMNHPVNQTFFNFIDLSHTDTFLLIAETKTFARTVDG